MSRNRMSPLAGLVGATFAVSWASAGTAPLGVLENAPSVVLNMHVENRPWDFAISPDGLWAVVRTASWVLNGPPFPGKTYVIRLQSPYAVQSFNHEFSADFYTSDSVGLIDGWCATGSGLDYASNQFFPLQSATSSIPMNVTGAAADIVAVLDANNSHPLAVMRSSQGGVGVWDLLTGTALPGTSVPSFTNNGASGICWATSISDSVQATPTRYIAIANSDEGTCPTSIPQPWNHGFVGIASLDGTSLSVTHGFTCNPASCNYSPQTPASSWVHDVALTPNQSTAVVSGNRLLGVFNMSTGAKLFEALGSISPAPAPPSVSALPAISKRRNPFDRMTTDSVAATNSRAIVIGHNDAEGAGASCFTQNGQAKWRIALLKLRPPIEAVCYEDSASQPSTPSRAHDVALTPNGAFAFVTTRVGTYRVDMSSGIWPSPVPEPYYDGTDPLQVGGSQAFVTNSIACTNTKAVVIGRNISSNTPQAIVIDVNTDPQLSGAFSFVSLFQSAVPAPTLPVPKFSYIVPTDVLIDPSESFAIVRSMEMNQGYDPSPQQGVVYAQRYGRVSIIRLSDAALVVEFDQYGGLPFGASWGINHLAASADFAITGGEHSLSQGSQTSEGWVQIVKLR